MKNKKQVSFFFRIFSLFVLLVSIASPLNSYAAEENKDFSLTIMHMNDTHAHVDQLPNMLTAIKEIRNEYPDALLFHAGDVFSGTLYFNQFHGEADLALLNLMNVDAMTFGNHEFDLGSSENGHQSLSKFVKNANFPFLGTNVDFSGDTFMKESIRKEFSSSPEDGKVYDGMIKEVNGEKIGIFGLTTEDTANIASPVNVKFLNYVEEAKRAVAAFQELGINKIIAVSHLGYDSNAEVGNDLLLAQYVDGIDVIVGGHSHTQLNEPVSVSKDENGNTKEPTLIVQAYQYANYLGDLKVDFDQNGVITNYSGQLIDVTNKQADQEALSLLDPYKNAVDALSDQEIGANAEKTLSNPRLSDSEISVRANETELGNIVTDAMLAKAKERYPDVVIAMQNGGGIRAAIDEGPITVGEVIAVLPFGNDPAVVELSGQEIKEILEYSVRLAPEENGGFLHVAGMKFTYDSTKDYRSRIVSMQVNNNGEYVDIQADQKYLITTNNFTAKGGDGFDVFAKAYAEGRVKDIGQIDWEQLRDYLVELKNVNPVLEGRIVDLKGNDENQSGGGKEENPKPEEADNNDVTNEDPIDDESTENGDTEDTSNESSDSVDKSEDTDGITNEETNVNKENANNQNQETNVEATTGNQLPNTATTMYTILLVGSILISFGIAILVIRKKKQNKSLI